jgi:glycosyltransferase involved in cell wall biosynthesis
VNTNVTKPGFGVVIPTRNRPVNIHRLVLSLEHSTLQPTICVIIDSSDFSYDISSRNFQIIFVTPGVRGQVQQRNYGILLLQDFPDIEYVMFLDDDIVVAPSCLQEAMTAVEKYASLDTAFVGFALNIVNLKKSSHILRRLLLHPPNPGRVSQSAFCSSLSNLDYDMECEWVLGGAAVWSKKFLSRHLNDYPFKGKAYSEDLYYSSLVRNQARFFALARAKCRHEDNYEIASVPNSFRVAYREGVNDTRIRIYLAKRFPQYSVYLATLHTIWVSFVGVCFGIFSLNRNSCALGMGRLTGLFLPITELDLPARR